jgi:hypothetical protein
MVHHTSRYVIYHLLRSNLQSQLRAVVSVGAGRKFDKGKMAVAKKEKSTSRGYAVRSCHPALGVADATPRSRLLVLGLIHPLVPALLYLLCLSAVPPNLLHLVGDLYELICWCDVWNVECLSMPDPTESGRLWRRCLWYVYRS